MKLDIGKLKLNPDNPRTIRDDNFKKLVQSVKDFPEMTEIRPVVVNKDYMILGGNMRYRAMKEAGYKEVDVKVVELTPEQEKEFIIKDNVSGGEWDWESLLSEWDKDLLEDWGLDVAEDKKIDDMQDNETIEFEQSVQIEPPQEYILIMAEPNSVEWEELKETLKLKIVRRGGYKKGSPFESSGLERVLTWSELKSRLDDNSSTKQG